MAKSLNDTASNLTGATFTGFYSQWMEAKRKRENAVAVERNILKQAEAAGIDTKAMKELEKERVEGSDAVEAFQKSKQRLGAWMGLPLYAQANLFAPGDKPTAAPPAAPELARAFAHDAGYESGKAGGSRTDDNPFPPGSPNHVAWDAGYMEGQGWIAQGLGKAAKRADTSKLKPEGKPRKTLKLVPDTAKSVADGLGDDTPAGKPN